MANIYLLVDTGDASSVEEAVSFLQGLGETAEKATKPAAKPTTKKTAAKKPTAQKEEPAPEAEAEETDGPGVTRDQVRDALKSYAAIEGKDAAIAILKDHGASSLGELDEAKFADVFEAAGGE